MSKQNVLNLNIDLQNIKNIKSFRRKIQDLFCITDNIASDDVLDEYMRDLVWINENYIIANFSNLHKVKDIDLQNSIRKSLSLWKNYWDNTELYEEYNVEHPYGKTVIIIY